MSTQVKKIGVITSGGDCQAMNAAVRAIVIAADRRGIEVVGIKNGYYGMAYHCPGDFKLLKPADVENIIDRGGTILNSARFAAYGKPENSERIAKLMGKNLSSQGIDAMIIIGGDGSFRGGNDLMKYTGIPCIGIPGTIDNDIVSTDYTLGFDTALNNTIFLCDALRDTCNSHKRCNVIEVMGRNAGQIALKTAIACGATAVAIPEDNTLFDADATIEKMIEARKLRADGSEGKRSFLVIFAEGAEDPADPTFGKKKDEKKAVQAEIAASAVKDYNDGQIDADKLISLFKYNFASSYGERFAKKLESRSREAFKELYEKTGNIDYDDEYIEPKFARFAHTARGGVPTVLDRVNASLMGERAVELLTDNVSNRVVGVIDGEVSDMDMATAVKINDAYHGKDMSKNPLTPDEEAFLERRREIDRRLIESAKTLMEI